MHGCTDARVLECTDAQMYVYAWLNRCTDAQMHRRMDAQILGCTEGMHGCTDDGMLCCTDAEGVSPE